MLSLIYSKQVLNKRLRMQYIRHTHTHTHTLTHTYTHTHTRNTHTHANTYKHIIMSLFKQRLTIRVILISSNSVCSLHTFTCAACVFRN